MAMKVKDKIIEAGGKRYKLTKLDADAGSYVAFKLAGVALPLMNGLSGKVSRDDMQLLSQAITSMGRQEFTEVQKILLSTVLALETSGGVDMPVPVLKADGTYTDEDLRTDAKTVIALTIQAALFNIGGFFDGEGLSQSQA
jgi:hypothetical protein